VPPANKVGYTSELGLAVTGGPDALFGVARILPELEIRYLGAVREGPMRATATRLGPWVRVEVVDLGNDDRPVAIAAAGVAGSARSPEEALGAPSTGRSGGD